MTIRSKPSTKEYQENYDKIFVKKEQKPFSIATAPNLCPTCRLIGFCESENSGIIACVYYQPEEESV